MAGQNAVARTPKREGSAGSPNAATRLLSTASTASRLTAFSDTSTFSGSSKASTAQSMGPSSPASRPRTPRSLEGNRRYEVESPTAISTKAAVTSRSLSVTSGRRDMAKKKGEDANGEGDERRDKYMVKVGSASKPVSTEIAGNDDEAVTEMLEKMLSVVTFCQLQMGPGAPKERLSLAEIATRATRKKLNLFELHFGHPTAIVESMIDAVVMTLEEFTLPGQEPPWIELYSVVETVTDHSVDRLGEWKAVKVAHVFLALAMENGSSTHERHVLKPLHKALDRLQEPLEKLEQLNNREITWNERKTRGELACKVCEVGLFIGSLRRTGKVAQLTRMKVVAESFDHLEFDLNKILFHLYSEGMLDKLETEHVYPTSRPWNVPYPQDHEFRGNDELLGEVFRFLHGQDGTENVVLPSGKMTLGNARRKNSDPIEEGESRMETLLLWGPNGLGKTSIAVEFAYRNALDYDGVLWVDCDPSADEEFAQLAEELDIELNDNSDLEDKIRRVQKRFESGAKFLLILDDIVNFEELQEIRPRLGHSHILITSKENISFLPSIHVGKLPLGEAKKLIHLEEMETGGVNLNETAMETIDQIIRDLDHLPLALDIAGHIMIPKRPPEHHLSPMELLERLHQDLNKKEEKKSRQSKKQMAQAFDRIISDERFSKPSSLKNLFDCGLETLVGQGSLLDVASHYAHGELAIAILEAAGWFGPQEIPLPLIGIAARIIRPVKGKAETIGQKISQYWEDITDTLAGRSSLDDDEDQGDDKDLELAIEKLARLGMASQNETTDGVSFHQLVQEYSRSRPNAPKAANAVMQVLLGARCFRATVDHFNSFWVRRNWLESQNFAPEDIYLIGFRLADHWSTLNQRKKVDQICEEAMLRGKALGDLRFRFWQLKNSYLTDGTSAMMHLAHHEMQKCFRQMPKELASGPLGLLVEVQIMYYSIRAGLKTLSEVQEQCAKLETLADCFLATVPERDTSGPYGDYVANGPGEVMALAVQTLSLLHFENDVRPESAVKLLTQSSEVRLKTAGPRDHSLSKIHKSLGAAFTRLLFLAYQQQFLHDAFRIVERGVPTDLLAGDAEAVLGGGGGHVGFESLGKFRELARLRKEAEELEEELEEEAEDEEALEEALEETVAALEEDEEEEEVEGEEEVDEEEEEEVDEEEEEEEEQEEEVEEGEEEEEEDEDEEEDEEEEEEEDEAEAASGMEEGRDGGGGGEETVGEKDGSESGRGDLMNAVSGNTGSWDTGEQSEGSSSLRSLETGGSGRGAEIEGRLDGSSRGGNGEISGRIMSMVSWNGIFDDDEPKSTPIPTPKEADLGQRCTLSDSFSSEGGGTRQQTQRGLVDAGRAITLPLTMPSPARNPFFAPLASPSVNPHFAPSPSPKPPVNPKTSLKPRPSVVASGSLKPQGSGVSVPWDIFGPDENTKNSENKISVPAPKILPPCALPVPKPARKKNDEGPRTKLGKLVVEKVREHMEARRNVKKVLKRLEGAKSFHLREDFEVAMAHLQARKEMLLEREVAGEAKAVMLYEGLLPALWPPNNAAQGDVHFDAMQRQQACHILRRTLSTMRNVHGLEGAFTLGRLVLIERVPGEEGKGKLREARQQLEEALSEAEGNDSVSVSEKGNALAVLALVLERLNELEAAQQALEQCLALVESKPASLPRRLFLYSWILIKRGKLVEARASLLRAFAGFRAQGHKRLGSLASTACFLGVVEWLEGHPTAAQGYLQEACQLMSAELGPDHLRVGDLLTHIGWMQLCRTYDVEGAIVSFRHVLRIHEKHLDSDNPALAYSLTDLALAMEQMDRESAAREIRRQAVAYTHVKHKHEREILADVFARHALQMMEARKEHQMEIKGLKERALAIIEENNTLPELRPLRRRLMKKSHLTEADMKALE